MIIAFKKKPSTFPYFVCLIAICAFIGFAAVKVLSNLTGEQRVASAQTTVPDAASVLYTL